MRTDEDQINYGNKRDIELENLVGNLLVAEYQVDRLRTRLGDIVNRNRPRMKQNNASTHIFKHQDKWYRLSLRIEETDVTPAPDIAAQNSDYY
jgi:hypothetical protein